MVRPFGRAAMGRGEKYTMIVNIGNVDGPTRSLQYSSKLFLAVLKLLEILFYRTLRAITLINAKQQTGK